MGEFYVQNGKVLKVHFVCAAAVHLQLFSYADWFFIVLTGVQKKTS